MFFGVVVPIIMCLHVVAKEVDPPPMKSELGKKLVLAIELIAIYVLPLHTSHPRSCCVSITVTLASTSIMINLLLKLLAQ
jgi:hypothetical protein